MNQRLVQVAVVVADYDEAISFYKDKLDFEVVEDKLMTETKRWVVIKPKGEGIFSLLLAKALNDEQRQAIGNQSGGRVFLFLHTDDFWRDYNKMAEKGIVFVNGPREEVYGTVAVFKDLYGNLWDFIQPKP